MTVEFQAWPKIPRLNRPVTVTEKIDGTNAAVIIEEHPAMGVTDSIADDPKAKLVEQDSFYSVAAQSRKRLITPEDDNFGFARWVHEHAEELVKVLGPGRHFGEWWGSGIQRGYGLPKGEKRFSLFNTKRWDVLSEATDDQPLGVLEDWTDVPGLRVVPTLAQFDTFDTASIASILEWLRRQGSLAVRGFDQPEGIVIYHHAANSCFKVMLENDDVPKAEITRAMEMRSQKA